MAQPKGIKKTTGSGRKKGTPNKITLDLIKAVEEAKLDPIRRLKRIIRRLPYDKQADICLRLMDFIYPKRKPVDAEGKSDDSGNFVVNVQWADEDHHSQDAQANTAPEID